jgi:inhibitor of KinA
MPSQIAAPRRDSPRTAVPAGSVGIAGAQTGIYPIESPGGWQLIGRTPIRLFSAHQSPPAQLTVGDRVRFRSISRSDFDALASASPLTPR